MMRRDLTESRAAEESKIVTYTGVGTAGMGEWIGRSVAVVGGGVVGRSWALVFARAGLEVRLHDPSEPAREAAVRWLEDELAQEVAEGRCTRAEVELTRARLLIADGMEAAVAGADYVQESGPEDLATKRTLFRQLDVATDAAAILASSTSSLDATQIAAGLPGAARCLVAHPVNPPHVIPVVELVPGRETSADVVERARRFLAAVGQQPVVMRFFLPGFLVNRMQIALIREALSLLDQGAADVETLDTVIRDGLGLRWTLLGPFGVATTNADDGARGYLTRYGHVLTRLAEDLGPMPVLDADTIELVGRGTDRIFGGSDLAEVRRWRDAMIRRIRELKARWPHPAPQTETAQT